MNDLNGGGAEDFLHWAVPGEHAVLDAVEEKCRVAEGTACAVPRELRRRSRACCSKQRVGELVTQQDFSRRHGETFGS